MKKFTDFEEAAFRYDCATEYHNSPILSLYFMNISFPYCEAIKFKYETAGLCCCGGKVKLEPLKRPPEPLKSLLTGQSEKSKHFLTNIQAYNNCFQMTSFEATKVIDYH